MRSIVINLLICFALQSTAQPTHIDKGIQLAESEKQTFAARHNATAQSLASGNFVVDYYRCEWNINPALRYISGSVTSYFTITTATSEIVYDLSKQLIIDSVRLHKKLLSFSQKANNTLVIHFSTTLSSGKRDSVSIFYHGTPPDTGYFAGSFVQTTHGNNIPVLWTLSEPYGAMAWWPCRNGLDDKADSIDIYITHPSQYNASSNGIPVSEITTGGFITSHYKHRYPIASYLVGIAVTNYSVDSRVIPIGNHNVPLIQYVYPEDLTTFQNNTYTVSNALQLYSSYFGLYPFAKERYGQTEFSRGGGMEHQTNSFVTSATENLMTHELGHQWFGDKVTCGSWRDIWLNEGFATYLADMFYTEMIDTTYYMPYVEGDLSYVVSQPGGSVWVNDTTNINRIFDSRLTYKKGAFLLRMLRWTLGDSTFFKGIKQYLNDPQLRYGFATTADLQRNLESASGQNLDYFFKQWFYGEGYPSFKVQWGQDSVTGQVNFIVSEKTSVPLSVDFFKVALPIQLMNGSKKKTITLMCKFNNQQFTVPNPGFKIKSIGIDSDHYLISANNKAVKQPSLQFTGTAASAPSLQDGKIWVSPNPVTTVATVTLQNVHGRVQLKLFNSTGVQLWTHSDDVQTKSLQLQIPFGSYVAGNYRLVLSESTGSTSSATIVK